MNFMTPEEYAAAHDPKTSEAEAFEERAAMLEFQAGFDRETAETMAGPMAANWTLHMNLFVLRMNAIAIASKKRKGR
jgi:hypothetical protein